MSYQIPQQLEYKEKVMFGLTFKQLLYAFIFGLIALLCFKRISNVYISFFFASIFALLGVSFMFFNFDTLLKNYYRFYLNRKLKSGDKKLEDFVGVKDINDDLIITTKNKKVAIIQVQPINFNIKEKEDKEGIISSFQKFLNSIDFPTQIVMRTESIDLGSYIKALESRITKEEFANLFEGYKKYLSEIISNNKIMNRVFYFIIPEQTNIQIQTDICLERLGNLNLKSKRLKTKELQELLVSFFNGKDKLNFLKEISPKYINNFPSYLESNDHLHRIIYASGYPRNVEAGFLDKLISSMGNFDLSIHIKPYPIERMLIDINRQLQKQRADLFSMNNKGITNPTLEIQYADTRHTLENLQKGEERLFNISLYINCKADTIEDLNLLTKKIESELNGLMILPKVANLRMLQGFRSTLPLGIDELKENRNITTEALSAFFPYTSQFLEADNTGVWLGLNKNSIPIIKDIFKLPNPNGLVLAQSGGGKSYFCKLLITRYLMNGTKVMIIDPQGEYGALVDYFKGQRICLSKDSDLMINPLDLMGHDYIEKRLSLVDLMKVMLGDLSEPQKAFIDRAITEAYKRRGIIDDPETWNYEPPILSEVYDELGKLERRATQLEKSTLRSLMNRLSMYTEGVFSFLNKQTNINFNNDFVCFDIGSLPKQVKPTLMFLVLDYIYMKMKSDLTRKILLIDEAWTLLSRTEDAGYIFEIVKTCRKFNMGLLLINQEVEGLLDSSAGKSVLANSAYTMLMRQKPAVIDNICKTFHLSKNERDHLLTASVGEGLLILEDDHSKIKVIASPEEHKLITTNADELLKIKNNQSNIISRSVKINLDESLGYFLFNKLSKEEVKYLLSKNYKISEHKSFLSGKSQKYLLKPRFNESPGHCFMVYDIRNYLEKNKIKVETPTTKKPDIIFQHKGKIFAIEVETGSGINHAKKFREKLNILEQYENWFFVVTTKRHLSQYKKYGKVIDPRFMKSYLDKIIAS